MQIKNHSTRVKNRQKSQKINKKNIKVLITNQIWMLIKLINKINLWKVLNSLQAPRKNQSSVALRKKKY